jgi:hypothetical protein
MLTVQYELDYHDSLHGNGYGLDWGSTRHGLSPPPGTLFSPVGRDYGEVRAHSSPPAGRGATA